jgi:hypothetical protein
VLKDSQMVYPPAPNVLVTNATLAPNLLSTPRLSMQIPAVMTARSTDNGLKVSTPESTEIKKSSTP